MHKAGAHKRIRKTRAHVVAAFALAIVIGQGTPAYAPPAPHYNPDAVLDATQVVKGETCPWIVDRTTFTIECDWAGQ